MIELSLHETRVLGVLFEKERTTPDQYPLSLNALTNACNQKSNREPVLSLDENEVQLAIDSLVQKQLVKEVVMNGRVSKYRQRFANTEFSEFSFSRQEHSVLCVLFLRGPQTPGELRTRANRLCDFANVNEVETVLNGLMNRTDGDDYVACLPREPGKRESRYMHLFSGKPIVSAESAPLAISESVHHDAERVAALEQKVDQMQADIDELKRLWQELNS